MRKPRAEQTAWAVIVLRNFSKLALLLNGEPAPDAPVFGLPVGRCVPGAKTTVEVAALELDCAMLRLATPASQCCCSLASVADELGAVFP